MKVKTLVDYQDEEVSIPAGTEGYVIVGRVDMGDGDPHAMINFRDYNDCGFYRPQELEFVSWEPGEPDEELRKIVMGEQ